MKKYASGDIIATKQTGGKYKRKTSRHFITLIDELSSPEGSPEVTQNISECYY